MMQMYTRYHVAQANYERLETLAAEQSHEIAVMRAEIARLVKHNELLQEEQRTHDNSLLQEFLDMPTETTSLVHKKKQCCVIL